MNLSYAITKWPNCGVGNKLLYYWNLVQAANARGIQYESPPDKDMDSLIKIGYIRTQELRKIIPFDFCLGENFYDPSYSGTNRVPIENIFRLRRTKDKVSSNVVSIHLRGGDFRVWKNGEGLLSLKYYTDAVDYFLAETSFESSTYYIQIISDDSTHPHLIPLQNYIKSRCGGGIRLIPHTQRSICDDWYTMAHSEWIISSPSTFAITAGMVSNARIIHSEKWVNDRVNDTDPFWVGLNNGGNKEYNAEVLI